MEGLAQGLAHLAIDRSLTVSIEDLRRIVKQMEEQATSSMPLKDVVDFLIRESKLSALISPTFSASSKTGAEGTPVSPPFTFQTPSKPFTPFVFKGADQEKVPDKDQDPDLTDGDNGSSSGEKPLGSAFFTTARQSIPSDFSQSTPTVVKKPGAVNDTAKNFSDDAAGGINKEPASVVPGQGTDSSTSTAGGGWFWSHMNDRATGSTSFEASKEEVKFQFNIGAAAKKGRSKASSAEPPTFEFASSIPTFQSAMNDKAGRKAPSPTPVYATTGNRDEASAFMRSFTLGTGDILSSLKPGSVKPEPSNSSDLEDDESWTEPMDTSTPNPPSQPRQPEPTPAPAPTAPLADSGSGDDENVNINLASSFQAPEPTVAGLDFTKLSFAVGADDASTQRSTRKSARKKDSLRKPRASGDSTPVSPQRGTVSGTSDATAETGAFAFQEFAANVPESAAAPSTPPRSEPNESFTQPNTARGRGTSGGMFSPRRSTETSQSWWQPQTPRKGALHTPRKSGAHTGAGANEPAPRDPAAHDEHDYNKDLHDKTSKDEQGDMNLLGLAELYSKQGKELYGIGLYDRALDAYSKCLNLAPKTWPPRATILGNRAAVFFMMQQYVPTLYQMMDYRPRDFCVRRYRETVNDCEDALKMDKGLVKLLVRKGKALVKMGLFNDADSAFARVLEYSSVELLSPEILASMAEDERHIYQQTVDSAKMEAKAGLREVNRLRDAVTQLIGAEGRMVFDEVLRLTEDILGRSPLHRAAQIAKANALCELSKYEDAKAFMEEVARAPAAALYAHIGAKFPFPAAAALAWSEDSVKQTTSVDLLQLQQAMLCMGPELANYYLLALKNIRAARNFSQDVMTKVMALLEALQGALSAEDRADAWSWVAKEVSKMKEIMALKATADQQFKAKNFRAALHNYALALKVDPAARRWCAILYSNRAATNMSLGMYADAVTDCHNAISKDSEYGRAYLRRGRAYRAMGKSNDAIRDYRRYLCSDPTPSDFKEVQLELDECVASNTATGGMGRASFSKPGEPARPAPAGAAFGQGYGATGARRGAEKDKFSHTWQHGADGQNGSAKSKANPTRGASMDSEDFEDVFAKFKSQHSGRSSFPDGDKPQSPRPSSGTSQSNRRSSYGGYKSFLDENDDDDDDGSYRSHSQKPKQAPPKPQYHTRSHSTHSTGSAGSAGSATGGGSTGGGLFSLKEADHYTVLGVDTVATEREIKMSYRKLALQFHPDKNRDPEAEERFKKVSLAYTVLSDRLTRREYDLTRPVSRYRR